MTPVLALRAALRAVLADIGLTINDEARNALLPYASFGEGHVRIWSDGATNVAEHRIAIHVWSRAPGDAEVLELAGRIAAQIEASKPSADLIALVHWNVGGYDIRRPTREGVRHVALRIVALSEHARGEMP